MSRFFNWCIERGYIEISPASKIKKPAKENPKDRILTEDELKKVYLHVCNMPYPFGPLLKILILTGQRKGEVSGMLWSDINYNEKLWTIPKERTKNGRSHTVPLSEEVIGILKAIPRFLHSDIVFTTTRETPVSGFGKIKERIQEKTGVLNWTIHDLRRTAASGMAGLEIQPHVIEKILNHVSGTFSGVAGVYNRYSYDKEKREALNNWTDHVMGLTYGRKEMDRTRQIL